MVGSGIICKGMRQIQVRTQAQTLLDVKFRKNYLTFLSLRFLIHRMGNKCILHKFFMTRNRKKCITKKYLYLIECDAQG